MGIVIVMVLIPVAVLAAMIVWAQACTIASTPPRSSQVRITPA